MEKSHRLALKTGESTHWEYRDEQPCMTFLKEIPTAIGQLRNRDTKMKRHRLLQRRRNEANDLLE